MELICWSSREQRCRDGGEKGRGKGGGGGAKQGRMQEGRRYVGQSSHALDTSIHSYRKWGKKNNNAEFNLSTFSEGRALIWLQQKLSYSLYSIWPLFLFSIEGLCFNTKVKSNWGHCSSQLFKRIQFKMAGITCIHVCMYVYCCHQHAS